MKKLSRYAWLGALLAIIIPGSLIFAQQTGNTGNIVYSTSFIAKWIQFFKELLQSLPGILVALAGVVFMIEVLRFIFTGKDGKVEEKDKIKSHIMWSLVALFVLISFWGIVRLIAGTVGIKTGDNIKSGDIPKVEF